MFRVGSLGHHGFGISTDDVHTNTLGLAGILVMSFKEAGSVIVDFD